MKRTGFPTPHYKEGDRRELAVRTAASDLKKPIEDLLADIHDDALSTMEPDSRSLACTIAKFASLLCRLSAQASRIQFWIIVLTVAIAAMTAAILVLTWIMTAK